MESSLQVLYASDVLKPPKIAPSIKKMGDFVDDLVEGAKHDAQRALKLDTFNMEVKEEWIRAAISHDIQKMIENNYNTHT